jgi:hypothetical protein
MVPAAGSDAAGAAALRPLHVVVRRSTFNLNVHPSTFNLQRATFNLQRATFTSITD